MSDSIESRPFEDIRVLILEDNPADAELLDYELRGAGFVFVLKLVEGKKAYLEALQEFRPDIILSDYDLPSFSGAEALQFRKKICPETPFILVTGAIGEERAIEMLTGGATDYVLKNNLSRLLPAVHRALHENYEHRRRKEAEAERDWLLKDLERRVQERTEALETEISERRRVEETLREKEAALANARTGIAIADPEARITYVNDALLRMWGYEHPEEVLGSNAVEFWESRERAEIVKDSAAAGGWSGEMRAQRKDGSIFTAEVQAGHVLNPSGKLVSLIGTFVDITERKRIEEDHERLISELKAANRELESFTYSVSHDLRAPLRAVTGFLSALERSIGPEIKGDAEHAIEMIQNNARRMNHLIDDLLVLSRVGRSEIARKAINMNRLAETVWKQQLEANPGRAVSFERSVLPDSSGDESLIWQVLSNLFSNSLKYTRTRKRAVIEVGGEGKISENVYYVRDNGVGFDMTYREKLFGVFQRLHSDRDYEGSGVGLAIVHRIVSRHGGRVWAEGKVGKGAVFYFSLPNRPG